MSSRGTTLCACSLVMVTSRRPFSFLVYPPRHVGQLDPASGWEHDGQIVRELKTEQALIGMHGRNCKVIVVKPQRRQGYVCDPMLTKTVKEAQRRGIPIDERTVAWGERPRINQ